MHKTHKSILLFSGGLDSFIAWHYLKHPSVLFVKAGQSYVDKELKAVKYFAKKYPEMKLYINNSLSLSDWEEANHYIPYRNVLFSMVGSLYAPKVYLVGIQGDRVDDNNPKATKLMSNFFVNFNSNKKVCVTSPFYNKSKSQIVRWYVKQGLPIEELIKTRSCYSNESSGQCGECASCFRRWVALANNNIEEKYDSPPWEWKEVGGYIKKMKKGVYDKQRTKETLNALRKYKRI